MLFRYLDTTLVKDDLQYASRSGVTIVVDIDPMGSMRDIWGLKRRRLKVRKIN